MKKIYSLMIGLLLVGGMAMAQKHYDVKAGTAEIDGYIEEAWDVAPEEAISTPFGTETPSVTSFFKAMYDADNFYVVVNVVDEGNHWPGWESGGNNWEYDKPEIYWDWNDVLIGETAVGASVDNSGHYQLADGFLEDSYDVPITVVPSAAGNKNPGGTYCYSLSGEDYVYEMAVPFTNFYDKDGVQITKDIAVAKAAIGFDATIIDQDEGITTVRQRAVWSASVDECWNSMDGAGTVKLIAGSANNMNIARLSVSPNPAVNNVTINADFNRVVISNILGQQVKDVAVSSQNLNISDLSKGVYVMKAYKNDKLVGTAKVTKK